MPMARKKKETAISTQKGSDTLPAPSAASSGVSAPASLLDKKSLEGPEMPEEAKPPVGAKPPFWSAGPAQSGSSQDPASALVPEMTVIADEPKDSPQKASASASGPPHPPPDSIASQPAPRIHAPKARKFFSLKKSGVASAPALKKMEGAQEPLSQADENANGPSPQENGDAVRPSPDAPEPSPEDTMPKGPADADMSAPAGPDSLSADEKQILLKPYIQDSDPSRVLEAALFMSGQSLATSDLARLVGIAAVGHVNEMLGKLAQDYDSRNSSLEVVQEENSKWSMRVRASFAPAVRQFAGEAEISRHALRTLAYISKNNGITKRTLFGRLGSTIYEDVSELVEKGFVAATPSGRTSALRTSAKFKQYFEG